ncbi:MAG TPA: TetR/AcrR family transcriptional regulator [Pseudonocardiaceae bacterium]|nr:TetR/AcrR family transcriptional regulator [Pseudonocardiaceae bacterium]
MPERPSASTDYVTPIVRIAATLFAEQGYHGTSMRDIGREVGVHAGSLYVHIQSKEDLLEAIVRSIMERSEQDMAEVLAAGGTATEQLHAIAARDLKLIGENKEFATVFFHEWRNLSEGRQQAVIASRDRWETGLRSIIVKGIEQGEFRPVDPRIAGIALTSILNWAYVWYSPDGDLSTDQLADQFAGLLVTGLRAN